ncbi:hypothetical protein [Streptomyces sp. NPDC050355]
MTHHEKGYEPMRALIVGGSGAAAALAGGGGLLTTGQRGDRR